jgi:GDP-L-fucose synthase
MVTHDQSDRPVHIPLGRSRVLVTGGSGFVGSRVVAELQARGTADVVAPSHAECDLIDAVAVRELLDETRPDVVIHCAARVGGIGANRARPAEFFYENLLMGTHVLHESWVAGVGKVVAMGTVCAYPRDTPVPFREEDLWNGYPEETNAPYGLAKKMLAVQSAAYRRQYGFSSIFLLPTNIYGPGDHFDLETSHVIPALIRKFTEATAAGRDEVVLWGDGSPTREFLYVDDAARGIVLATERYDSSEPMNLGSGQEISIRRLSDLVARAVGYRGRVVWDVSKPNGQPRRSLDTSRAARECGFVATTSFAEGLDRTVAWYRANRHRIAA